MDSPSRFSGFDEDDLRTLWVALGVLSASPIPWGVIESRARITALHDEVKAALLARRTRDRAEEGAGPKEPPG